MTPCDPSPSNKCGKILQGITGKPLVVGECIDLDQYVGKLYLIEVVEAEKGSKVVSVKPLAQ